MRFKSSHHGQASQALIEFALISPVLLLLLFGTVDIGRAIFYYDTLNHAAREGARTAVKAPFTLPTNATVLATVAAQLIGAPVTAPCPQGPITSATPPANAAWLYVTEPSPPAGIETTPPRTHLEASTPPRRAGVQRGESGQQQRAAAGDAALQPDPDHAGDRPGDRQSHIDHRGRHL